MANTKKRNKVTILASLGQWMGYNTIPLGRKTAMNNPIDEREQHIYQALNMLIENPKIAFADFCTALNVDTTRLYAILDIIATEEFANNISFARGGRGNPIRVAYYENAMITEKGIEFLKSFCSKAPSNSSTFTVRESGLPTIFISYNWDDSPFADNIETEIMGQALVNRDKKNIEPWCSISEFMKTIRNQDFAVLIISDKYLQSDKCMFEVVQLMKDANWNDRTMYIVMDNAKVYDPFSRAQYIKYWSERCDELKSIIDNLAPGTSVEIAKDLREAKFISLNIGEFLDNVADSNNPTHEEAIQKIKDRLSSNAARITTDHNPPANDGNKSMKQRFSLSREATELLISASEDKNGTILVVHTLSGLDVKTNGIEFVQSHERREEAKWEGAVNELGGLGLIRATNYANEVFLITKAGYDATDLIKALKAQRLGED